jgi:hypothetical protein
VEVTVAYSRNCLEKLRKTTRDLSRTVVVPAEILTGQHALPLYTSRWVEETKVGQGKRGGCNKVKNKQKRGKK